MVVIRWPHKQPRQCRAERMPGTPFDEPPLPGGMISISRAMYLWSGVTRRSMAPQHRAAARATHLYASHVRHSEQAEWSVLVRPEGRDGVCQAHLRMDEPGYYTNQCPMHQHCMGPIDTPGNRTAQPLFVPAPSTVRKRRPEAVLSAGGSAPLPMSCGSGARSPFVPRARGRALVLRRSHGPTPSELWACPRLHYTAGLRTPSVGVNDDRNCTLSTIETAHAGDEPQSRPPSDVKAVWSPQGSHCYVARCRAPRGSSAGNCCREC